MRWRDFRASASEHDNSPPSEGSRISRAKPWLTCAARTSCSDPSQPLLSLGMGRHGRRGDGRDPRGEVPDGLGGLLPGGGPGVREVEVVSRSTAGRLRSRGLPGLLRRPGIGRSPSGHRRPLTTRTPTPCRWSRDRRCFVPLPTPFHSIQRSAWRNCLENSRGRLSAPLWRQQAPEWGLLRPLLSALRAPFGTYAEFPNSFGR